MLIRNKQIAIVGAGPAGLTLARLLQLKGANVKVYERDLNKDARVQGSPLDMHEGSGLAALRSAGLLNQFYANVHIGADKKIIVDERGKIHFSDHDCETTEMPYRPEIDRGTLRKVLLESLKPETLVWDSQFISMEKQDDGWLLHFRNGTRAYADLVVACDGANSRIRPYVTDIKALYSGITMVELNVNNAKDNIPVIYKLLNGGKVMAFGHGKCVLGGQKGTGNMGFYLSLKVDEDRARGNNADYADNAHLLAWFKHKYAGWADIWDEIIKNAAIPIIPRPIYYMPLNQTWGAQANVTLLGDAAHVMPPFAGEGANMAMLDALELSECITSDKFGTLQEAIVAYETAMCERAAVATWQSLENGERMHSAGALAKMLGTFDGK
ncbi:FAD-dependent monooxygenase [Mucilaginibacter psychrotolerans]|uniref:Flavin-dependent monooxygenase n=2 Tax=Mucilaginibacter psychrotolerans TaxID=1524096 RepID=A0A4Y8SDT8_9SPHI|nr:FAD-dependent monooxygenase [Mucilaginibacter psychrotolerans]